MNYFELMFALVYKSQIQENKRKTPLTLSLPLNENTKPKENTTEKNYIIAYADFTDIVLMLLSLSSFFFCSLCCQYCVCKYINVSTLTRNVC